MLYAPTTSGEVSGKTLLSITDALIDELSARPLRVRVEGEDEPIPAISLDRENDTRIYVLFRELQDWPNVEKVALRLRDRFVITRLKSGWALWLEDPSAIPVPASAIVELAAVQRCHVKVEGHDRPVPAIRDRGQIYSFFRSCPDWDTTEKIAGRLKERYAIARVKKGWTIWVLEPHAVMQ